MADQDVVALEPPISGNADVTRAVEDDRTWGSSGRRLWPRSGAGSCWRSCCRLQRRPRLAGRTACRWLIRARVGAGAGLGRIVRCGHGGAADAAVRGTAAGGAERHPAATGCSGSAGGTQDDAATVGNGDPGGSYGRGDRRAFGGWGGRGRSDPGVDAGEGAETARPLAVLRVGWDGVVGSAGGDAVGVGSAGGEERRARAGGMGRRDDLGCVARADRKLHLERAEPERADLLRTEDADVSAGCRTRRGLQRGRALVALSLVFEGESAAR